MKQSPPTDRDGFLRRYPRICAHIIAESLGYAMPNVAANILCDAAQGRENRCEWVDACYGGDARAVVRDAIVRRAHHEGYMASYGQALAIVRRQLRTGHRPVLASWF
jgi:hypothetical protein